MRPAFVSAVTDAPVMREPPQTKSAVGFESFPQTAATAVWLLVMLGMAGVADWRHRQLAQRVKRAASVTDERVLALLDEARVIIGLRRPITAVVAVTPATPAVFGFYRPRLLWPPGLSGKLDDDELRLIFLHELTHVRRGDALLNWIAAWVRAVHRFNPQVWLALGRLRGDQELACDAAVRERLVPAERRRTLHLQPWRRRRSSVWRPNGSWRKPISPSRRICCTDLEACHGRSGGNRSRRPIQANRNWWNCCTVATRRGGAGAGQVTQGPH